MAWEDRSGREYYYRKHRIGPQVFSEYLGTGSRAEFAAMLDELEREESEAERQAWEATKAEVKEINQGLDQVGDLTRIITRACLLAAGYHPHKGQWRKRRNG